MSIAGKVHQVKGASISLRGKRGESAGQDRMTVSGKNPIAIKPGASIWGSASSVEVQNPGSKKRHIFTREGYTRLRYEKSL